MAQVSCAASPALITLTTGARRSIAATADEALRLHSSAIDVSRGADSAPAFTRETAAAASALSSILGGGSGDSKSGATPAPEEGWGDSFAEMPEEEEEEEQKESGPLFLPNEERSLRSCRTACVKATVKGPKAR
jgi:hypothetical protein